MSGSGFRQHRCRRARSRNTIRSPLGRLLVERRFTALHYSRLPGRLVLVGGSGGEVVGPITSGVSRPSDCGLDTRPNTSSKPPFHLTSMPFHGPAGMIGTGGWLGVSGPVWMVVVPSKMSGGRSSGSVLYENDPIRERGAARRWRFSGKVTAADRQCEAKPLGKDNTSGPDLDLQGVDLAGLQRLHLVVGVVPVRSGSGRGRVVGGRLATSLERVVVERALEIDFLSVGVRKPAGSRTGRRRWSGSMKGSRPAVR